MGTEQAIGEFHATAADAAPHGLLGAVEHQRLNLLNVLGMVQCMGLGMVNEADASAPEMSAAFDLLELEIQRVLTGLEEDSLCQACLTHEVD